MQKYFVFTDIDGALNDKKWLLEQIEKNKFQNGDLIKYLKPESVKALNYLLEQLSYEYEVHLVITSSCRKNMPNTIGMLKVNGVKFHGIIESTPISNNQSQRGYEIMSHLAKYHNSNKSNMVVIDDNDFDYFHYFKANKIIKTNLLDNSLNMQQVKDYLSNNVYNKNKEK